MPVCPADQSARNVGQRVCRNERIFVEFFDKRSQPTDLETSYHAIKDLSVIVDLASTPHSTTTMKYGNSTLKSLNYRRFDLFILRGDDHDRHILLNAV